MHTPSREGSTDLSEAPSASFNVAFEWMSSKYGKHHEPHRSGDGNRARLHIGLIALTGFQFVRMPSGFIPEQDIGYLAVVAQLPPGASLERTDAAVQEANDSS